MAESVLPGVFIEVRPEGLIVPDRITVGNLGVVGTASKGPIGEPVVLGSYADAVESFGDYDPWIDGTNNELTLVRALEQAYQQGATTAYAVRVAAGSPAVASIDLASASGPCVRLQANSPGSWGAGLEVNISAAEENAFVEGEAVPLATLTLAATTVVKSARNRIQLTPAGGLEQSLQLLYDDDAAAPVAGQVKIDRSTGALTFDSAPPAGSAITASYAVAQADAVKVTLRRGVAEEVFTVVSGDDLITDLGDSVAGSAWATATALPNSEEAPDLTAPADTFLPFSGGSNGAAATGSDYQGGLDRLLEVDSHIVLAAGQGLSFADELAAHCRVAASDDVKRDRVALVGSELGASLADVGAHTVNSDRVILVAPGIRANDAAAGRVVTLSASFAAAAVAGLLSSLSSHISLTNKVLDVGGLEKSYSLAELKQLVQSRVLALEQRQGFRITRAITTSTNTAWKQITTRRIVDFAKFGVRSAANPFIGRLNNDRVRSALRTAINGFLVEMVSDEKLISYELDVSATRDQQIRGIVQVTMVLRPVFSIEFIKVTIFLE